MDEDATSSQDPSRDGNLTGARAGNNTIRRGRGERARISNRSSYNNWASQRRHNTESNHSNNEGAGTTSRMSTNTSRQSSNGLASNIAAIDSSNSGPTNGRPTDDSTYALSRTGLTSNARPRHRRRQPASSDSGTSQNSRTDRGGNVSPSRPIASRGRRVPRGREPLFSRFGTSDRQDDDTDMIPSSLQLRPEPFLPPSVLMGEGSSDNPFLISPDSPDLPDLELDGLDLGEAPGLSDEELARRLQQEEWEVASARGHDHDDFMPHSMTTGRHPMYRRRGQAALPRIRRLGVRNRQAAGTQSSNGASNDRDSPNLFELMMPFSEVLSVPDEGSGRLNIPDRRDRNFPRLMEFLLASAGMVDMSAELERILNPEEEYDYEQLLAVAEQLGEVSRGMSQSQINKIPTSKHHIPVESDGAMSSESNADQCNICLTDYENGDKKRNLPCKHDFHMTCVDQWLKSNATCPVCREDIKAKFR